MMRWSVIGNMDSKLAVASINGLESDVRLLLNAGADVNTQFGEHGNALQVHRSRP